MVHSIYSICTLQPVILLLPLHCNMYYPSQQRPDRTRYSNRFYALPQIFTAAGFMRLQKMGILWRPAIFGTTYSLFIYNIESKYSLSNKYFAKFYTYLSFYIQMDHGRKFKLPSQTTDNDNVQANLSRPAFPNRIHTRA